MGVTSTFRPDGGQAFVYGKRRVARPRKRWPDQTFWFNPRNYCDDYDDGDDDDDDNDFYIKTIHVTLSVFRQNLCLPWR